MDAECTVAKGSKGGRIAALGKGRATGIDDQRAVGGLRKTLKMGMTVDDGIVTPMGKCPGMIVMTVRQEVTMPAIGKDGIGGHNVEMEQHLVDLGIAVSTNGNDFTGMGIEEFHHPRSIHAFRYTVTGTVIEDVAQKKQLVIVAGIVKTEYFFQWAWGSVKVGSYKIAHIKKTFGMGCIWIRGIPMTMGMPPKRERQRLWLSQLEVIRHGNAGAGRASVHGTRFPLRHFAHRLHHSSIKNGMQFAR